MAASAAFGRLQPWSAYWLALRLAPIQHTSSPVLGPVSRARESFHFPLASVSCSHTWFSLIGCAAAHQSPIRIKAQRALRCVAPGCIGSPRKPSVPHRVQSTRPIQPAAQVCGFARMRSNPLWLTVRAQRTLMPGRDRHAACNQLSWFFQPPSDTAAAVPLIARLLIRRPSIPRRACRPS